MKGVYKSRGTLEETLHPARETQEETNQLKAVQGQSASFEWKLCHDLIWFSFVKLCSFLKGIRIPSKWCTYYMFHPLKGNKDGLKRNHALFSPLSNNDQFLLILKSVLQH